MNLSVWNRTGCRFNQKQLAALPETSHDACIHVQRVLEAVLGKQLLPRGRVWGNMKRNCIFLGE